VGGRGGARRAGGTRGVELSVGAAPEALVCKLMERGRAAWDGAWGTCNAGVQDCDFALARERAWSSFGSRLALAVFRAHKLAARSLCFFRRARSAAFCARLRGKSRSKRRSLAHNRHGPSARRLGRRALSLTPFDGPTQLPATLSFVAAVEGYEKERRSPDRVRRSVEASHPVQLALHSIFVPLLPICAQVLSAQLGVET